MIMLHPQLPQMIIHSDGKLHVIGLSPDEMRALGDELHRRADETETRASQSADVLLDRVAGQA